MEEEEKKENQSENPLLEYLVQYRELLPPRVSAELRGSPLLLIISYSSFFRPILSPHFSFPFAFSCDCDYDKSK